jgi:phospholipase D3/4
LQIIFEQYWWLAGGNTVPSSWPIQYWGDYDKSRPLLIGVNGSKVASFIAVSPPSFCPPTRTHDDDALLDVFRTASQYVKLSVMDYSPFYLYSDLPTLWPDLDDEIRLAALRGVKISFILALWNHTVLRTIPYLQSLAVLPNVEVRLLIVPPGPGPVIPFTRVDHSKYAISESRYYITTSNWTPDYFESTAGVSLSMISNMDNWVDMDSTFMADWNSQYTVPIFQRFPPAFVVPKKK